MSDKPTSADLEYQGKKRRTRRERFLEQFDSVIPWQRLEERIRPHYPKAGPASVPASLVGAPVRFPIAVTIGKSFVSICPNHGGTRRPYSRS